MSLILPHCWWLKCSICCFKKIESCFSVLARNSYLFCFKCLLSVLKWGSMTLSLFVGNFKISFPFGTKTILVNVNFPYNRNVEFWPVGFEIMNTYLYSLSCKHQGIYWLFQQHNFSIVLCQYFNSYLFWIHCTLIFLYNKTNNFSPTLTLILQTLYYRKEQKQGILNDAKNQDSICQNVSFTMIWKTGSAVL